MFTRSMINRTLAAAGLVFSLGLGGLGTTFAADVDNDRGSAEVVVALRPGAVSSNSAEISVVARNLGEETARSVTISLPYNSSAVSFVGASGGNSAVSVNATGDKVEVRVRNLGDDDSASTTLRFAASENNQGGRIEAQASYSWNSEQASDKSELGLSNRLSLLLNNEAQPTMALSVGGEGQIRTVSSAATFIPGEQVVVWATPKRSGNSTSFVFDRDGAARVESRIPEDRDSSEDFDPREWTSANGSGAVSYQLYATDLAPGEYTLVTYGYWSGITTTASIVVR
jgi:hypothetical protein